MTPAQGRVSRFAQPDDARADPEEIEAIARSRVEHARIDILLEHSCFAAALLAIPLRGTSEPAISHAVVTDGSRIVYRFDLVAALERPKVCRLILHALAHVLLKHPERGGTRNWEQWTAACDIAVEELFDSLGIGQGDRRLKPAAFRGHSAEEIYAQLSPSIRGVHDDGMLPPEGDAEARAAIDLASTGTTPPTPRELTHLAQDFGKVVERARERPQGTRAGSGSSEIDAAAGAQVCWRQALARFMREPIDREWSFARPNRKHLWRGLYLPGPTEIEGGRFVVAIDTSASMSDRDLGRVLGEIDAIRCTCACELTVLQFDAAIHAKAEFSRWSDEDAQVGSTKAMRVFGRGGTDLRLPFTWADEERAKGRGISALIVCTDGHGPLPQRAPDGLPVLFLLTPSHSAPRFGERVVLART